MQVNVTKSKWCTTELELLGFWQAGMGYHLLKKGIKSILVILPPKKQIHEDLCWSGQFHQRSHAWSQKHWSQSLRSQRKKRHLSGERNNNKN